MSIRFLPTLNAMLNATSGILIVVGFIMIRRRNVAAHRACMIGAVATSIIFLISYLIYHYHAGATRFAGTGLSRPFYFFVLTTHTVLAATIVPFVVVTLRRALKGEFARHLKVARWTFPMWVYVSVTGVIVYFMLYHIYPSRP
jgi:putative membrane protein